MLLPYAEEQWSQAALMIEDAAYAKRDMLPPLLPGWRILCMDARRHQNAPFDAARAEFRGEGADVTLGH